MSTQHDLRHLWLNSWRAKRHLFRHYYYRLARRPGANRSIPMKIVSNSIWVAVQSVIAELDKLPLAEQLSLAHDIRREFSLHLERCCEETIDHIRRELEIEKKLHEPRAARVGMEAIEDASAANMAKKLVAGAK